MSQYASSNNWLNCSVRWRACIAEWQGKPSRAITQDILQPEYVKWHHTWSSSASGNFRHLVCHQNAFCFHLWTVTPRSHILPHFLYISQPTITFFFNNLQHLESATFPYYCVTFAFISAQTVQISDKRPVKIPQENQKKWIEQLHAPSRWLWYSGCRSWWVHRIWRHLGRYARPFRRFTWRRQAICLCLRLHSTRSRPSQFALRETIPTAFPSDVKPLQVRTLAQWCSEYLVRSSIRNTPRPTISMRTLARVWFVHFRTKTSMRPIRLGKLDFESRVVFAPGNPCGSIWSHNASSVFISSYLNHISGWWFYLSWEWINLIKDYADSSLITTSTWTR